VFAGSIGIFDPYSGITLAPFRRRNVNVITRSAHASGLRMRGTATPDYPQTLTHHNSLNMNAIDEEIEDLESRDRVDKHMFGEVALKYDCSGSAVSRR
jgi:hypothetical protein